MAYTIPDNTNTPEKLLEAIVDNYSGAGILILIGIFMIITITGYFSEISRRGHSKIQNWLMISSFITTGLSFILFLMDGFISIEYVGICFAFFILFTTWALFTND